MGKAADKCRIGRGILRLPSQIDALVSNLPRSRKHLLGQITTSQINPGDHNKRLGWSRSLLLFDGRNLQANCGKLKSHRKMPKRSVVHLITLPASNQRLQAVGPTAVIFSHTLRDEANAFLKCNKKKRKD